MRIRLLWKIRWDSARRSRGGFIFRRRESRWTASYRLFRIISRIWTLSMRLSRIRSRRRGWKKQKLAQAGDFYLTSSVDHLIEMAGSRAGKAAALQWLAGELRIAPEEVMACGNAENDRDMLLYAGYGVAVANSPESLKRDADYVTEDNNHARRGKCDSSPGA